MKDSYSKVFSKKKNVLVVLGHPDDTEIICGGTLARLVSDGKNVRVVVMTNGDKGMHDRTDISPSEFRKLRLESQVKAARVLGIEKENVFNLDIPDGQVEDTYENIGKLVFHIRQFKPDIIITQNPFEMINDFSKEIRWINHRDHRKTGQLTLDAAYPYCRDAGFFPEHLALGLKSHEVNEFLIADSYMKPSVIGIEVSDFIDIKRKALECHTAGGVLSSEEIDGYIDELQREGGRFEVFGYEIV